MDSGIFWIFIEVVSNCLSLSLFVLLLNRKLDTPLNIAKDTCFVGFAAITLTCANLSGIPYAISLATLCLVCYAYAYLAKKGSAHDKLFWTAIAQMVYHVCNHVVASLMLLSRFSFVDTLHPTQIRLFAMVIYAFLEILFFLMLLRSANHLHLLTQRQLMLFLGLTLLIVVISGTLMNLPGSSDVLPESQRLIAVAMLALTLLLFSFILGVDQIALVLTQNHELKEQFLLERHEKDYVIAISEGHEALRKAKHDYGNQLLILQGMVENREYAELTAHLQSLTGEIALLQFSATGYTAIDTIITAKRMKSSQLRIAVEHQAMIPQGLAAMDTDIAIMLGNIWDNALEATQLLPDEDRRIMSIIEANEGNLLIQLRNSCDGMLYHSNNILLSRRNEGRIGIGLTRVQQITRKYDGNFSYQIEDWGGIPCFTVRILLPLPM